MDKDKDLSRLTDVEMSRDDVAGVDMPPTEPQATIEALQQQLVEERAKREQLEREFAEYQQASLQFWSNLKHELRIPLQAVSGFIEVTQASDKNISSESREHLKNAEMSSRMVLTVMNDALLITRLEFDREKTDPSSVNLANLLTETVENAAKWLRARFQKNLGFTYTTITTLPKLIEVDEWYLRSAIVFLYNMAVNLGNTDKINLTVEAHQLPNSSNWRVRFTVANPNPLLSNELLDSRYKPFGTGLYYEPRLCYKLVELLGGTLNVETEPEQGTSYWFELILPETVEHGG